MPWRASSQLKRAAFSSRARPLADRPPEWQRAESASRRLERAETQRAKKKDSPGEDGENRRVLHRLYTRRMPESIKVCLRWWLSPERCPRVSEGGLEPPPPYRGLGPQPSASTKFRHSDRVADRVYETRIGGSTSQILVRRVARPLRMGLRIAELRRALC